MKFLPLLVLFFIRSISTYVLVSNFIFFFSSAFVYNSIILDSASFASSILAILFSYVDCIFSPVFKPSFKAVPTPITTPLTGHVTAFPIVPTVFPATFPTVLIGLGIFLLLYEIFLCLFYLHCF